MLKYEGTCALVARRARSIGLTIALTSFCVLGPAGVAARGAEMHPGLSADGLASYVRAFQLAAANTPKPPKEEDDLLTKDENEDDDLLKNDDDDDLLTKEDEDEDSLLSDEEKDGDTLLTDEKESTDAANKDAASDEDESDDAASEASEAHEALFAEAKFPSAGTCGTCHPKHYREWSVSQHSYSQLSPVYLSLSNRINQLANGTNGDFCLRCHNQVGANLGEDPYSSNLLRHPTSREGITCVVCHRIEKDYNKASGRLALVEGGLTAPIFGPMGNAELARVLDNTQDYRVVTEDDKPGRKIHKEVVRFTNISSPMFCGACHDVTLFNGFRLEEAFSEYRLSPAAARGDTCQDCHMGKVQGKKSGYEVGPAAVVGGVETEPRKITNHYFAGPDHSIIHPGIFPHNSEAQQMATLEDWLAFDHEAGWGTDTFEDTVTEDMEFPERWRAIDDRYDAREILDNQFALLDWANEKRLEVLRIGYVLGDIITEKSSRNEIAFRVQIRNGTDGHNVPTGFTGERVVWLEVTVSDADGNVVFKSGDRDPNGDLRDGHSAYVHAGELPLDTYLLSLQSIFVTQSGRGAETEEVIPIPYPTTSLPRVLPSTASLIFTGEPSTERNHKKGIEPNGERWGHYVVDSSMLGGKGPYKADIKLNSQMAPANLLLAMQSVGFDYGMTPLEVGTGVVGGTLMLWHEEVMFDVD